MSGPPPRRRHARGVLAGAALGAGAWAAYTVGAQGLLPWTAWRQGAAGGCRVALTFDDGPDAAWTPRLLDLLARRGVRATFFLVGERARRQAPLVRAMAAAGHEVANHTWRHRNAFGLGPGATAAEILVGARILADVVGRWPRLYRPPWGMVNAAALLVARRHRLTTVLWSLQPEGLRARAPGDQLRYLRARLHDGAVVDLHDAPGLPGAPERLLALMPALLDLLEARQLAPTPVGAMLGATGTGTSPTSGDGARRLPDPEAGSGSLPAPWRAR